MGSATTSSAGQSFFRGSLQALAFQGVSEIGLHLDLPPPFTNALAVVAGTMTGAAIDPSLSISQGLQQLAPQLASDFALSGFVALGNKIGLDPRLTGLFSAPLASLASGFTAGLAGNSKNIFNLIKQSLSLGLTNAVSYGIQLGLNKNR